METFNIGYRELVDIVLLSDREVCKCVQAIKVKYPDITENMMEEIHKNLMKSFLPNFSKKWQSASRNKNAFIKKNKKWLDKVFSLTLDLTENVTDTEPGPSQHFQTGRPEKSFDECCDRAKRYKIKQLRENYSEELIVMTGRTIENLSMPTATFSPGEALALVLDASLSKYQYEILRKATQKIGHDIFPSYSKLLNMKKECYPTNVDVTESCASVNLQALLDHTTSRILKTKSEELKTIGSEMTLVSKWGCDGSSGHSEYKQAFDEENVTDASIFLTSLVPLHLHEKENDSVVIWKNTRPSSTRFCRPIKFQFVPETSNNIKNEVARMETEIENINNSIIQIDGKTYNINHKLLFTMIDGKIAQTVTGTPSMAVCYICKTKPSDMNNLDAVRNKPEAANALNLGLSPLHARIKFMECILHIAYNKSFKSWRTNIHTKPQQIETKKRIQEQFIKKMGLKVDFVKRGMGTSNDGNTSRRFFSNPKLTAEITGVDENLIHRFSVILQTINSSHAIDSEKFGIYCNETADLFVQLYSWYNMSNTVHKILLHGSKIITAAMLPIGMLTEEAQEARNKDYRQYRLKHSRKCSRICTNEDTIHMLLASSDPYINSLRTVPKKKMLELNDDVKALLAGDNN